MLSHRLEPNPSNVGTVSLVMRNSFNSDVHFMHFQSHKQPHVFCKDIVPALPPVGLHRGGFVATIFVSHLHQSEVLFLFWSETLLMPV